MDCEDIVKKRDDIEIENQEILDLISIVSNDKFIKIADFDKKVITEKENLFVEFNKRLDGIIYFIENNIKKYRLELIGNISKFGKEIKTLMLELNDKIINEYSEENMQAIFYMEDKSVKIKKLVEKKDNFRLQERNIELETPSDMSILNDLEYEYQLKSR